MTVLVEVKKVTQNFIHKKFFQEVWGAFHSKMYWLRIFRGGEMRVAVNGLYRLNPKMILEKVPRFFLPKS